MKLSLTPKAFISKISLSKMRVLTDYEHGELTIKIYMITCDIKHTL